MIDLTDFYVSVDELVEELEADIVTVHTKLALDMLGGIVRKTPVDTGRARGNWQVTINEPAQGESLSGNPVGVAATALTSLRPYEGVWITNNVPYIAVLEFGLFSPPNPGPSSDPRPGRFGQILVKDGFSTQAPQGMVRTTIEEILASLR